MMKQYMFGCNNSTEINQIVLDHVNSSSMDQEHEENSYLHFPHPFLDDDDLFFSHFLSQQQQQQLFSGGDCWKEQEQEKQEEEKQDHVRRDYQMTKKNSGKKGRSLEVKKKKKCSSRSNSIRKNGSSTKRTGKKDRHSKICTAQGPRDRRMRLSLQIARKFFDLQDMLGFDKASKTIEWLLSNSNSAIKNLKHSSLNNNNNNSGLSHGSVCSGSSEVVSAAAKQEAGCFIGTLKAKKSRQLRTVGRESRDRARARARQRTILKKTPQPISISQDLNSDQLLQEETHLEDCPKVFAFSDDLSDYPSIHTFFSGNINHDYPTLSCPNAIFNSFSDSTLLKLP